MSDKNTKYVICFESKVTDLKGRGSIVFSLETATRIVESNNASSGEVLRFWVEPETPGNGEEGNRETN